MIFGKNPVKPGLPGIVDNVDNVEIRKPFFVMVTAGKQQKEETAGEILKKHKIIM